MADVTTLAPMWHPLMGRPSVRLPYCPVCGRTSPLEQHHPVRRGAGRLYRDGREVPKPTVTLCGLGSNLMAPDGTPYCHGLAHANRLHFRWAESEQRSAALGDLPFPVPGGHWEYLKLDEPCDYLTALSMGGWRRL